MCARLTAHWATFSRTQTPSRDDSQHRTGIWLLVAAQQRLRRSPSPGFGNVPYRMVLSIRRPVKRNFAYYSEPYWKEKAGNSRWAPVTMSATAPYVTGSLGFVGAWGLKAPLNSRGRRRSSAALLRSLQEKWAQPPPCPPSPSLLASGLPRCGFESIRMSAPEGPRIAEDATARSQNAMSRSSGGKERFL